MRCRSRVEPRGKAGGQPPRTLCPCVATDSLGQVLTSGRRSFSFELFPPKTDEGERMLWQTVREIEALKPTFVSVTYGAGGSTQDRTVRLTGQIADDTTLTPVAHLTCVGASRDELRDVVGQYAAEGVNTMLALRGDPPTGLDTTWEPHPGGLEHAVELVELIRSLGTFSVGVAAFPEGHPESRRPPAGRPGAGHEAAGRRGVRHHAAVLPGGGLRAPRRERCGRGLHDADRARDHAGDQRRADRALRRALGCGIPRRAGGPLPRDRRRPRCGRHASASRWPPTCASGCWTSAHPACTSTRSTARTPRSRCTRHSASARPPASRCGGCDDARGLWHLRCSSAPRSSWSPCSGCGWPAGSGCPASCSTWCSGCCWGRSSPRWTCRTPSWPPSSATRPSS